MKFSLEAVLSVVTGRNLCDLSEVYRILGHMTGEQPLTHQVPRFENECQSWLVMWFGELSLAKQHLWELDDLLERQEANQACSTWVSDVKDRCGLNDQYEVHQIPQDDHDIIHPRDELIAMRGTDEGIIEVII